MSADFIYFSGGDPGYLLSVLENSLLWKAINTKYQEGLLLAGSSAGAMVMGHSVITNPGAFFVPFSNAHLTQGLDIFAYPVIPHFNRVSSFMYKKFSFDFVGIDEDTALVIQAGSATIMGKGKVLVKKGNDIKIYNESDTFVI